MNKLGIGCAGVAVIVVLFAVIFGLGLLFSYQRASSGSRNRRTRAGRRCRTVYQPPGGSLHPQSREPTWSPARRILRSPRWSKSPRRARPSARSSSTRIPRPRIRRTSPNSRARKTSSVPRCPRLLVVSERYPELKANNNFRDLQAQLEEHGKPRHRRRAQGFQQRHRELQPPRSRALPGHARGRLWRGSNRSHTLFRRPRPAPETPPKVQNSISVPRPPPATNKP